MKKKCRVYRELPKAQGSANILGRYNYNMLDPNRRKQLNVSAGTGWNTYTGLTGSLDAALPFKLFKSNSTGISNVMGRGYLGQNEFGKTSGFNLGVGFENKPQGQGYQPFISGGVGYDNQLGWNAGFHSGGRWPINFDVKRKHKFKNIDGSFGWENAYFIHSKPDPRTGHIKPAAPYGSADQRWSAANSGRHNKWAWGLFGDLSTKLGPGNLSIYGQANIDAIQGKARRGDLSVPIEEDRNYIDRQTSSQLEFAPSFTLGARYDINTGIPKIKDIVRRREAEKRDKEIDDRSTPSIFKAGGENNMPFNELSQGSNSKPKESSYLQGFIKTMQQNIQNFQTDGPIADSIDILNYASDGLPEFKKSGSKKKWIQGAVKQMKNKGTVGAFTQYCGGKVTAECIERGLNSPDKTVQKRARFAKAMRNLEAGGEVFDTYKTGGSKGPCWKNYKMVGMKNKGGRQVPNCVPKKQIGGDLPSYRTSGYLNPNTVQNPAAFDAQAYNYVINNQGPYDIQGGFQNALKTAMKDWSHNQYYAPKGVPENAIITGYEPGMGKKTSKLYYFNPANPKQPNTNTTAQQNITSHPLQGTPTYNANQAYFPPTIYKFSGSTLKAQNSKDVTSINPYYLEKTQSVDLSDGTTMNIESIGLKGEQNPYIGKSYHIDARFNKPADASDYYTTLGDKWRNLLRRNPGMKGIKFKNSGSIPKAQASTSLPGQMPTSTNQLLNNPLWNPNWGQNVMNTWRANSDELELEKVDDGRVERAIANFYTPAAYGLANFLNRDERQLAKQMLDFNRSTEESTAVSLAERGQHEVNRNPFTPGLMPHRLRGSAGGFEVPIATAQFGLSVGDVGEYSDEDLQALIDAGYEFEYI